MKILITVINLGKCLLEELETSGRRIRGIYLQGEQERFRKEELFHEYRNKREKQVKELIEEVEHLRNLVDRLMEEKSSIYSPQKRAKECTDEVDIDEYIT